MGARALGRARASTDGVADASAHLEFSSIWRVPVEGQTVWLKVVPHFFAHEGALLALLAGAPTPIVLGHDGGRMLAEIAGEDLHDAKLPRLRDTVNLLVNVQRQWGDHTEDLITLGLHWRAAALGDAIADVVDRTHDEIRRRIAKGRRRRGALPSRFDEVAKCGL